MSESRSNEPRFNPQDPQDPPPHQQDREPQHQKKQRVRPKLAPALPSNAEISRIMHVAPLDDLSPAERNLVFALEEYGADPAAPLIHKIEGLSQQYDRVVNPQRQAGRLRILNSLLARIDEGRGSYASLFPFVYDDNPHVVTQAGMGYALHMPLENENPLTGPESLLDISRYGTDEQAGAMIAAILLLGDRRTKALLDHRWCILGRAGRRQLANAWTGFIHASTIDFYLDWLEDSNESGNDEDFGQVAGALGRMARTPMVPLVTDMERTFPCTPETKVPVRMIARWKLVEYAQIIAPRLRRIAAEENGPDYIMPELLGYWGLEMEEGA